MKEAWMGLKAIDYMFPYRQHRRDNCGPASLLMVYRCFGAEYKEEDLEAELESDDIGTSWILMVNNVVDKYYEVNFKTGASYFELQKAVENGNPVVVEYMSPRIESTDSHYSVVRSMGPTNIVLADPAFGDYYTYEREDFIERWHGVERRAFMQVSENISPLARTT